MERHLGARQVDSQVAPTAELPFANSSEHILEDRRQDELVDYLQAQIAPVQPILPNIVHIEPDNLAPVAVGTTGKTLR